MYSFFLALLLFIDDISFLIETDDILIIAGETQKKCINNMFILLKSKNYNYITLSI